MHPLMPAGLAIPVLAIAIVWALFTAVVYGMIIYGSIVELWGVNNTLTFKHYVTAFSVRFEEEGIRWTGAAWDSFWTTITIAAIAAPLTAAVGLVTAYLLTRQSFAGKNAFEFGTMLSFAIPGTIIGVSYILAFNVPPIEITGTGVILVVSFIFRNMPVGVRAGIASMSQLDKSLDESSLTLGANSWQTFRRVILPLLRPAILAALVYSFVRAMTAISAVIFLVSAEYDMATEAPAPPEPEPIVANTSVTRERSERGRLFGKRDERKAKKARKAGAVMASPAADKPPGGATTTETTPGDAEPQKADEQPPEADEGRHIIYTAGMRIAVFNLADAVATAESIPERHGGYVQSMSNSQVVLRIPSKNLRSVMTSLAGYGNVEQRWLNSQDVTAEYTDLESRLKALEKTHAQLLDLLGKARTVEEALKVREALDRVAAELEVLKGRLRQLDNMTTYSTLTLDFYERGPHTPTPSSNDPFPWVDGLGVENTEWK